MNLQKQVPGEDPQGPQFKTFPRSATVDRNGAASFSCEMEGPPKTVTWMKDGKELREVPMKTRLTSDKTRKVSKTVPSPSQLVFNSCFNLQF